VTDWLCLRSLCMLWYYSVLCMLWYYSVLRSTWRRSCDASLPDASVVSDIHSSAGVTQPQPTTRPAVQPPPRCARWSRAPTRAALARLDPSPGKRRRAPLPNRRFPSPHPSCARTPLTPILASVDVALPSSTAGSGRDIQFRSRTLRHELALVALRSLARGALLRLKLSLERLERGAVLGRCGGGHLALEVCERGCEPIMIFLDLPSGSPAASPASCPQHAQCGRSGAHIYRTYTRPPCNFWETPLC
jgi:hypothetical protein